MRRVFAKRELAHSRAVWFAAAFAAVALALGLMPAASAGDDFPDPEPESLHIVSDDGVITFHLPTIDDDGATGGEQGSYGDGARLAAEVGGGWSAFTPEPVWEPQPWNIDRGPNWTDRVLLTYDDCMNDPERFVAVLDRATELDIGLLIFPTGNCVMMFENLFGLDLQALIRDRGHWVGNHTLTHPHLNRVSRDEMIRQITGWPESNLLRPPFGSWNYQVQEVAESMGMRLVMWDLDTSDWRGRSEQEVVEFISEHAQPGYNVLMHLQHQAFTVSALEGIQNGLRERGLELCRPARPDQRPTPIHVPDNIC